MVRRLMHSFMPYAQHKNTFLSETYCILTYLFQILKLYFKRKGYLENGDVLFNSFIESVNRAHVCLLSTRY